MRISSALLVWSAAAAVALAPLPGLGVALAAGEPTVAAVLDAFTVDKILEGALPAIEDAMVRRRKEVKVPESHAQTVLTLARRIFPAKNLYKTVRIAYAKGITGDQLKGIHDWQLTVTGIRMATGLGEAKSALPAVIAAYIKGPGAEVLKPNRRNALATLVDTYGFPEITANIRMEADLAILMGLSAYDPPDIRDRMKTLKAKVRDRAVTGYLTPAKTEWRDYYAFAFKALKNEELDDFTRWGTTTTGRLHTKTLKFAVESTLDAACATLRQQVEKSIKGKH